MRCSALVKRVLWIFCLLFAFASLLWAEDERHADVVVNAEEDEAVHDQFLELGEYGQPAWAERSRAAATTKAYVLSPYESFAGIAYEADFSSHQKFRSGLTQEIDVGLPHRFEVGIENEIGFYGSSGYDTRFSLEGRYAFADWNKLPFNPAISVEYLFGVGANTHSAYRHDRTTQLRDQPDAIAANLLLARSFADDKLGYAVNLGFQQEVGGGQGRHLQINQALSYELMKGRVEVGAEMRYIHSTSNSVLTRNDEFALGPALSWKPWRQTRIALTGFFGVADAPSVATVLLVSYEFGGAEANLPALPAGVR